MRQPAQIDPVLLGHSEARSIEAPHRGMEEPMPSRGSLALLPRTRRGLVLFWTALFMLSIGLQYAAAMAPRTALATECQSFAIQTTDKDGNAVNQNHFASKPEVYLNGGPGPSGTLTPGTVIYYQTQEPDGTPLSDIRSTLVQADQTFRVQLFPFDTTSNNGGEYKVVASLVADLKPGDCTKSDNFKVDGPGSLKIVKAVEGGEASGDFNFHVDCGLSGSFNVTVTFPSPGFKTITGIDNLAECTVTETGMPNPPAGFEWGDETITGSPATIHTNTTVTVTVTNHLEELPNPSISITKGVSTSDSGPFEDEITVPVGTTVFYEIVITNTGNVDLTDITLTDSIFDLTGTDCESIPDLDVGEDFTCMYSDTAVEGETHNVATVDSEQTGEEDDDATVNGTLEPILTIEKSN